MFLTYQKYSSITNELSYTIFKKEVNKNLIQLETQLTESISIIMHKTSDLKGSLQLTTKHKVGSSKDAISKTLHALI